MKPAFALDLDRDSATLLHRTPDGWLELGKVALSSPDLDGELKALRARAEALAPDGFTTKLILPPSQLLYTEVEATGNDRAGQRAAIIHALKGRTPYPVSELVFDWSRVGQRARVVVVAKVTLEEAESFVEDHGFNPVCFVAIPAPDKFGGEPFFGLTSRASEHMPNGARLDRDQDPVRVVTAPPAFEVAESTETDEPAGDGAGQSVPPIDPVAEVAAPNDPDGDVTTPELSEPETAPAPEEMTVEETLDAAEEEPSGDISETPSEDVIEATPEDKGETPFEAAAGIRGRDDRRGTGRR